MNPKASEKATKQATNEHTHPAGLELGDGDFFLFLLVNT